MMHAATHVLHNVMSVYGFYMPPECTSRSRIIDPFTSLFTGRSTTKGYDLFSEPETPKGTIIRHGTIIRLLLVVTRFREEKRR